MSLDHIVERALAEEAVGEVELIRTVTGQPCLSDGRGWLAADWTLDLGRWR